MKPQYILENFREQKIYRLLASRKVLDGDKNVERLKAPVAKTGYSSGLVCRLLGEPQVAGSNPARGSKVSTLFRRFHFRCS